MISHAVAPKYAANNTNSVTRQLSPFTWVPHHLTLSTHHLTLSTQEAADLLRISRTALVRLLETGATPFEKPSRHRKVRLDDLLDERQCRTPMIRFCPHDGAGERPLDQGS